MRAPSDGPPKDGARLGASGRWPSWAAPALVAAVAAATFVTALRGDFVWDDLVFFPPGRRLLGVANPWELFQTGIWSLANVRGFEAVPVYRPVSAWVLWLLAPRFGSSPLAWHLLSIALHATSAVMVYALARGLDPERPRSAALAGALLFAVLPCHVEAIAWIMAYPHPLATLLALGAAYAQVRMVRGGAAPWSLLAAALALAAALTFEAGIVVAPLLLAFAWVEGRSRPRWYVWVGLGIATALPIVLRARAIEALVPLQPTAATALRVLDFGAAYLRDLVSPWPSGPYSSYPRGGVAGPGSWLVAAGVLAAGTVLAVRAAPDRRPRVWMALAWIVAGSALPILGAMNASPFFAPRALYLPSVGLALLAAAVMPTEGRAGALGRWITGATCVALVAVGNVASAGWRDDRTVSKRMLSADPDASGAHRKLAHLLQREGRLAEAEAHYRAAVANAPTARQRLDATEGLASLLGSSGRLDEAARLYVEVLREDGERPVSRIGLGNVAFVRGDYGGAVREYRAALSVDPRSAEAAHNLSAALAALGDPEGAARANALAAELAAGSR